MQILSTAPPNALNAFGCHIFKRHLINNTVTPAAWYPSTADVLGVIVVMSLCCKFGYKFFNQPFFSPMHVWGFTAFMCGYKCVMGGKKW